MTDIKEITQAYEFKPGGHYIVEVKVFGRLSKNDLAYMADSLERHDIHVTFVSTDGTEFALQAVPAIEVTDKKV